MKKENWSGQPCPGCKRYEIHKMCPAYGTAFYISDYPFTPAIEKLIKEYNLSYETQEILIEIIRLLNESPPNEPSI